MIGVANIHQETPNVRTYRFRYALRSKPGQFVMLWIPGVDQKPFSIGNDTGDHFELTVFALGKATKALFKMKVGDRVGVTGPFGSAYQFLKRSHLITVGGGYGAAPLGFLVEKAVLRECSVDFCIGARSKQHLLFAKRARRAGAKVFEATDDGSTGHHGYITEVLEKRLKELKRDKRLRKTKVFACGPELMQERVVEIAEKFGVSSEISLERYMKCGFGVCGNCCVDDSGQATCMEGPILSGRKAQRIAEFGKYHRDKMGIRHSF